MGSEFRISDCGMGIYVLRITKLLCKMCAMCVNDEGQSDSQSFVL